MRLPTGTTLVLVCALAAMPAAAAELTVVVRDDSVHHGDLYAALYAAEDDFLVDGRSLQASRFSMASSSATARFSGLPDGRYAVTVYVDTNGNGKLDTNLIGLPGEPYGFSRDARGAIGPPSFEDSAVEVDGDTAITINLR